MNAPSGSTELLTPSDVEQMPVTEWDARAEIAVGLYIERYLATHRPPDDASFVADFMMWAERLVNRGQAHLAVIEGTA